MNKYSDLSRRSFKSQNSKVQINFGDNRSNLHYNTIIFRNLSESPDLSYQEQKDFSPIVSQNLLEKYSRLEFTEKMIISKTPTLKLPEILNKSPTPSDFSALLEQIDKVISPRNKPHHNVLRENEDQKFTKSAGETEFFKIHLKGNRSPLQVSLTVSEGVVLTYTSFNSPHPGPHNYHKIYNSNYFEIFDKHYCFKSENLFIGVKAVSDSSFKIAITFAKNKHNYLEKKQKKTTTLKETVNHETEINEGDKSERKNFIRDNIEAISPKSQKAEIWHDHWEKKKTEVLDRKKHILQEKKDKAIETLHKKERKKEQMEIIRQKIEKETITKTIHKNFVALIYFLKATSFVRGLIQEKRKKALDRLRLNTQARKIQKFYKKKIRISDKNSQVVLAMFNINYFFKSIRPLFSHQTSRMVLSVVSKSAHNNLLEHNLLNYIRKITLIQRKFEEYQEKKRRQIKGLYNHWNKCVEKAIFKKKNHTLRKKDSQKYISIPGSIIMAILQNYYFEKWKEFAEEMKDFLKKCRSYKVLKIMTAGQLKPPSFKYLPTDLIMENLIKSALNEKKDIV